MTDNKAGDERVPNNLNGRNQELKFGQTKSLLLQNPLISSKQARILLFPFIYYTSLHVSIITVLIIRRSNFINTSSGTISLCEWLLGMPVRQTKQSLTYWNVFLYINQFNLITAPATEWRWIFLGSRQYFLAVTESEVQHHLFRKMPATETFPKHTLMFPFTAHYCVDTL